MFIPCVQSVDSRAQLCVQPPIPLLGLIHTAPHQQVHRLGAAVARLTAAIAAVAAVRFLKLGPGRYRSPRHRRAFEPLFLESNGVVVGRGPYDTSAATTLSSLGRLDVVAQVESQSRV
jgi:hypothetical protein